MLPLVDGLSRSRNPVSGQIVQHNDIARAQRRHENMLHIGLKNLAVHGAIMDEGCGHAREAQACGESGGFPMAMRNAGPTAFSA